MSIELAFPPRFLWGVSLSSQQTEDDNRNNNWSRWEAEGHMGDVRFGRATEWWSRAERDLDLARELGLNALRFSIEWSRIEPRPGEIDRAALDQYRRITEGMVARGLRPVICLHHFTNPLWFEDGGAFLAADAPARFERYAEVVAQRLGDLCTTWLTFNEPNVYALLGYELGEFPPGRRRASIAHARVLAAIARCHARAYRAIHDAQPAAEVGWAQHFLVLDPARPERRLDRWAARTQDAVFNDGFVRTLATGRAAPALRPFVGDLAEVRDCFDFVGLNLYGRVLVRFDLTRPRELFGRREVPPGARTGDGVDAGQPYGEAYPDGLLRIGRRLAALDRPIYVTEHGVADAGDRVRPWVLARGVRQVHALVREGVDVRGYFHWTLTDNVEWNWGWRLRFGLVALDETTQARAVRGSGRLYAAIARANAVSRDLVATYAPDEVEAVFADPA